MKSASILMKNTLLLALSSILMRFCAIWFQAYLASTIGAEQLGIFGIITSVGAVFATISISGVRFSTTRLVAEEISAGNKYPHKLMMCSLKYGTAFGICAGAGLYLLSGLISKSYVGDLEAAVPLRIMALSMPAISLGSCIEGYFTAKQKIFRLIAVQLFSQLVRIGFVLFVFEKFLERGVYPSDILATGTAMGEFAFAAGMFALYFFETFKKKKRNSSSKYFLRLFKTAAPLAVSAYMRTGLSSLGQVIIPSGLKKAGMTGAGAFASYGIISQMAMPVVLFPMALMGALGDVLIPRLTEAQVGNRTIGISYIVNRALRIGIIFSFCIMGVMLFFSEDLAMAIYKNAEAGKYIKIFAPLVPVIYVDCVTDGCLKGLGQQVHSMIYNVLEGVINVVLLFVLLPKTALWGYVIVMYVKELFNAVLSLNRLGKVSALDADKKFTLTALASIAGAWLSVNILIKTGFLPLRISVFCMLYVLLLYALDAVGRNDIKWITSLFKRQTKNKVTGRL